MRALIHAGMHKTGSSSIQQTFAALRRPGLFFPRQPFINHSPLFVLLFEDEDRIEDFHAFRAQGLRKRQLLQVREKVFSQLEGLLAGKDDGLFVLSAEAISHRHFHSAKERLRR